MKAYVIAKRGSEFLDTPVFRAGSSDTDEAVAVFTSHLAAQRYIDEAAWGDEYEVGELDHLQLLRWMVKIHSQGMQYLAIDLDRRHHWVGTKQDVLVIEEKLAAFAESLTREILDLTQRNTTGQEVVL